MKSYYAFSSNKLFWIKDCLCHRGIGHHWIESLRIESGSLAETFIYRDEKLQRLLRHAADTVPYYRKFFEGRDTSRLQIEDFPIISKIDVRNHEEEFCSENIRIDEWSRTSGSTGEPFRFGKTAAALGLTYADLWRGLKRFGIRAGDKRVFIKGVDEAPRLSIFEQIKRKIYGWINCCIVVDAHFLACSDANVEHELRRILRYNPLFLHGYVSSIYLLAKYAEDHQIDCSGLSLKAIVTESEKCYDFQRKVLERVFKARVVENYGCVEFGMIAQPAQDGVLCINEDHVFVETTENGEAVYTNLDEYGFPLIRFKNGDMLKLGGPHPKLPYRTIAELDGRKTEMIRLPQGGALQGFIVMHPLYKHTRYLKAYQIYQPDLMHLEIRMVQACPMPQEVFDGIVVEMRQLVGTEMSIKAFCVNEIPLSKRGKFLFVCSDVKE